MVALGDDLWKHPERSGEVRRRKNKAANRRSIIKQATLSLIQGVPTGARVEGDGGRLFIHLLLSIMTEGCPCGAFIPRTSGMPGTQASGL